VNNLPKVVTQLCAECDLIVAVSVFVQMCSTCCSVVRTMSAGLHPAIAASAGVILLVSYLYGGYWITSLNDEGVFDVPTVVASLLETEKAAVPRHGATVAVAFGGCRDRLASSVDVMHQLSAACPDLVSSVSELRDVTDLEKTFTYYFKNGVSARSASSCVFTFDSPIAGFRSPMWAWVNPPVIPSLPHYLGFPSFYSIF